MSFQTRVKTRVDTFKGKNMISLVTDSLSGEFVIVRGGNNSNVKTVSKRQVKILTMFALGQCTETIAQTLEISDEALKKDIAKICDCFEVEGLEQAVLIAQHLELIE